MAGVTVAVIEPAGQLQLDRVPGGLVEQLAAAVTGDYDGSPHRLRLLERGHQRGRQRVRPRVVGPLRVPHRQAGMHWSLDAALAGEVIDHRWQCSRVGSYYDGGIFRCSRGSRKFGAMVGA